MLDTSNSNPVKTPVIADWRDRLSCGDIVLFRFPPAGTASSTCPAPQPCLVLDIEILRGRRCAVLAPSRPAQRGTGPDRRITVDRRTGWRAAGLDGATRFSIEARQIVPLAHGGFGPAAPAGTPVLGRLPEAAMERLQAERARLHALRDIRRDREWEHSQDHRRRRRAPLRDRDFTVERRNIRRPLPLPPSNTG